MPVKFFKDLDSVVVAHRELKGIGDHLAAAMVNIMRFGFDMVTRYPKHRQKFPRVAGTDTNIVPLSSNGKVLIRKEQERELKKHAVERPKDMQNKQIQTQILASEGNLPEEMPLGEMRRRKLVFDPEQWLIVSLCCLLNDKGLKSFKRIVFLESIAGVPGMMAAMARHLHSLRLLRRDKGWIQTLLEDAANERQHLLVALKLYQPGMFMRLLLIGAQGVFCNFFFLLYLLAPRIAHRFVGVLEEEAVVTYVTLLLKGLLTSY